MHNIRLSQNEKLRHYLVASFCFFSLIIAYYFIKQGLNDSTIPLVILIFLYVPVIAYLEYLRSLYGLASDALYFHCSPNTALNLISKLKRIDIFKYYICKTEILEAYCLCDLNQHKKALDIANKYYPKDPKRFDYDFEFQYLNFLVYFGLGERKKLRRNYEEIKKLLLMNKRPSSSMVSFEKMIDAAYWFKNEKYDQMEKSLKEVDEKVLKNHEISFYHFLFASYCSIVKNKEEMANHLKLVKEITEENLFFAKQLSY